MTDTWQSYIAAAKAYQAKAQTGTLSSGDGDALLVAAQRHLDTLPTVAEILERRGLVSFQRLADWIARPRGDIAPDEARRKQAYADLWRAIAGGEFGPPKKPNVLFFPGTALEEANIIYKISSSRTIPRDQTERIVASLMEENHQPLAAAWAPRADVAKWYTERQHFLPPAPSWLAALSNWEQPPASSEAPPKAKPGTEAIRGVRTNHEAAAEEEAGRYIAAMTTRPQSVDAAFEEIKAIVAKVGTLSRRAFDRAWARNARLEWKNPGRRKCS